MAQAKLISKNTKLKLDHIEAKAALPRPLNKYLKTLLDRMIEIFPKDLKVSFLKPINERALKRVFINFTEETNHISQSKFTYDILKMDTIYSIELALSYGDKITLHFLLDRPAEKDGYVVAILHALQVFCHLFPANYHRLVIYVCLDDNKRDITLPPHLRSDEDKFSYLSRHSLAFTVSGVTYSDKKTIIITKKEEIIKLLFHEMIHYTKKDRPLLFLSDKNKYSWSMSKEHLNLSEAYTEFLAVVLMTAYHAIHLFIHSDLDVYQLFSSLLHLETSYSIYLCANLLRFFGYTSKTCRKFFQGIGEKKISPIAIWEYILLRTSLVYRLEEASQILHETDWVGELSIVQLMQVNDDLIDQISYYLSTTGIDSLSYILIDFNWDKF